MDSYYKLYFIVDKDTQLEARKPSPLNLVFTLPYCTRKDCLDLSSARGIQFTLPSGSAKGGGGRT